MSAADWQRRAACLTASPTIFETSAGIRSVPPAAAAWCAVCPVITQCLDAAMEGEKRAGAGTRYGIFGGLAPGERHALYLQRERAARAAAGMPVEEEPLRSGGRQVAPCGTRSAYERHKRNDEPVDDACAANRSGPRKPEEPACGTSAGYRAHRKRGEEACVHCRAANAAADRRLRNTGTSVTAS